MEPAFLAERNTDWVLLVMGFSFILLIIARIYDRDRVRDIFRLPWHVNSAEIASAYNPIQSRRLADFMLSLAALLVTGLAVYLVKQALHLAALEAEGWHLYARILFILLIFTLFKSLIGALVGAIFQVAEPINISQNRFFAYLAWLLMPLFPLVLFLTYSPFFTLPLAYMVLIIIGGGLLLALLKTAQTIIAVTPKISYNILYLCALEITPVAYLILILQRV